MNNHYNTTSSDTYTPEKPNHVRTAVHAFFYIIVYHIATYLLYAVLLSPLENQMVNDGYEPRYRLVMFIFSLLTLAILSIVMITVYFKNGSRKRAYLAATSAELRGQENAAEGAIRYRKTALVEAAVSTAVTAALWLFPACFYTISLSISGYGYGYAQALGIENFFVGAVGLFQPFQNALIGWLLGVGMLFCVHYFGRIAAHKSWEDNRIRH
ncbi:MAG: hypothetical protein IKB28_10280 [Clostridia bacterium]|nr:hypothetical protein [Clostridia bacterium]